MDEKLSHSSHGQIQIMQPQNILLTKSEVIVGYLQQMSLPSMFNRELSTEDYRLWDSVLGTYSIPAIRFSFETWISGGKRFPLPVDITPLCVSYHEQEAATGNYKPARGARMDGGNAQILLLWNMVVDRKAEFEKRGETYQPLTTAEWEEMIVKSKSGTYVSLKDSNRYYPNGNAKYNRELTLFMEARRQGGTI